jgi:hypothetical protein
VFDDLANSIFQLHNVLLDVTVVDIVPDCNVMELTVAEAQHQLGQDSLDRFMSKIAELFLSS